MAIVIESTSTNQTASSGAVNSLTITKPSGLVEGELLVAVLGAGDNGSTPGPDINTLSGWTAVSADSDSSSASIQYKFANSGDVAASNFTFTCANNTDVMAGTLLRVSGTENEGALGGSITNAQSTPADPDVASFTGSATPLRNSSLVVLAIAGGGLSATTSGYNSTPTVTYTELHDYSGGLNAVSAGAYGTLATAGEITAFGATFSSNVSNSHSGVLAVFNPNLPSAGTVATVITDSELYSPDALADSFVTAPLVLTDSETNDAQGKGTAPTQWTNESAPTTTWTNESV